MLHLLDSKAFGSITRTELQRLLCNWVTSRLWKFFKPFPLKFWMLRFFMYPGYGFDKICIFGIVHDMKIHIHINPYFGWNMYLHRKNRICKYVFWKNPYLQNHIFLEICILNDGYGIFHRHFRPNMYPLKYGFLPFLKYVSIKKVLIFAKEKKV